MVGAIFAIFLICFTPLCSQEKDTAMDNETPPPRYLYKVLSMDNWEASRCQELIQLASDDAAFIHFSKEDQLDRIVDKYWANATKFVVLKIAAEKLPGKLVFEANPGGENKYYHLYEGAVPFNSIVELRIIERDLSPYACARIVEIGNPVLRAVARALTKEEILKPETQALIRRMQATMRAAPGVGLAAPQIGESLQIIVIEDKAEYHTGATAQQLAEKERVVVPFHVIINPILHLGEEKVEFYEGCLSVSELRGKVARSRSVQVECLNERGEPVVINARCWYARIIQHEVDHLNGKLFIDRVDTRQLTTEDNYDKFWTSN